MLFFMIVTFFKGAQLCSDGKSWSAISVQLNETENQIEKKR